MKLKFEIKAATVETLNVTRKRDGQQFTLRKQEAWIDTGKAYPQRVELTLDRDQGPYPPGEYVLSGDSIYVDRNGRLAINPRLIPANPVTAHAVNQEKKAS